MKIFGALVLYFFLGGIMASVLDTTYRKECPNGAKMTMRDSAVISAVWPSLLGGLVVYQLSGRLDGKIECPKVEEELVNG